MKIRRLGETEYRMFKRIHAEEDALAIEEGKVRREKGLFLNLRQQSKTRLKQRLNRIQSVFGMEEWPEEDVEAVEQRAVRVYRNARRHKQRLRGLQLYEEDGISSRQG